MLRHVRWHCAGHQRGGERTVPLPNLTIAESGNKLGATYPERPCALKKEPTDRVCVFSEARLNQGHRNPPSGGGPGRGRCRLAALIAGSGALVVVEAATS